MKSINFKHEQITRQLKAMPQCTQYKYRSNLFTLPNHLSPGVKCKCCNLFLEPISPDVIKLAFHMRLKLYDQQTRLSLRQTLLTTVNNYQCTSCNFATFKVFVFIWFVWENMTKNSIYSSKNVHMLHHADIPCTINCLCLQNKQPPKKQLAQFDLDQKNCAFFFQPSCYPQTYPQSKIIKQN